MLARTRRVARGVAWPDAVSLRARVLCWQHIPGQGGWVNYGCVQHRAPHHAGAPAAVRRFPGGAGAAVSTRAHLARGCDELRAPAPARGPLTAPRPRPLAACPTARCTRASGGRPTATVPRARPSSRAPPGALPPCPVRAPSRCLPLPRACNAFRQQRAEMHTRVLPPSLILRLVGRWSHGNDRKQWQSDLSAVWTKQQVPCVQPLNAHPRFHC
jgi:hypothetical protein